MDLTTTTYIVVGLSFALYIGIAIWARAGSTGAPPTRAEIAAQLGFKSAAVAGCAGGGVRCAGARGALPAGHCGVRRSRHL